MRRSMRAALVSCVLAGCTYPEKQFSPPFGCFGAPEPSTAEDPVTLRGQTIDPFALMNEQPVPIADVMLTLQDQVTLANLLPPIASDPNGAFELSFTTGGQPFPVYLKAEVSGHVTTYHAPAREVTSDLVIPFGIMNTMQRDTLAMRGLGMPFPPGTGTITLAIRDCNDEAVAGATLTSNPAAMVRYFDGFFPDPAATATDPGGVVMIANLPPGPVTLTATVDDMVFPSRTLTVPADEVVQTFILP